MKPILLLKALKTLITIDRPKESPPQTMKAPKISIASLLLAVSVTFLPALVWVPAAHSGDIDIILRQSAAGKLPTGNYKCFTWALGVGGYSILDDTVNGGL